MFTKKGILAIISVVALIIGAVTIFSSVEKNNVTDWQHRQSFTGNETIHQNGGWYFSLGETITTYPKVIQDEFPINITFGDGGKATVQVLIRYMTPTGDQECMDFHRSYRGVDNFKRSMKSWVTNVMKSTSGIMTASEHAVGRKSEYATVVEQQIINGLYKKITERKTQKDDNDPNGKVITVVETNIMTDSEGSPILEKQSSFHKYKVEILEVVLGATDYDEKTLAFFAKKKEALLQMEQIRAEIRKETEQGRHAVIKARTEEEVATAQGLKELALERQRAEKEKMKMLIDAEARKLKAEEESALAIIDANKEKQQAEIAAQKEVEVAKLQKQAQLEVANAKLEVARIEAQAAIEEANAIKELADAKEEQIAKGGAITEEKRVLAEIQARRDAEVAKALSTIKVPTVIMGGQNGNSQNGGNMTENLINLKLLKDFLMSEEKSLPVNSNSSSNSRAPAFK